MKFLVQQQPAQVATGGSANSTPFRPDLPTVVFIHGAANDNTVWLSLFRQLAGKPELIDVNLLAPDLPGHGETFSAAKPRVEDYADWIINLLDNGAIANASLVGHSMGSLIALDCARRYPSRINKMMLVGTALPMPVSDTLMQAARERPDEAFDMLTKWSHFLTKNADGSFPPPTAGMQEDRAMLGRSRSGVLANDLGACAAYAPDEASLAKIQIPVVMVVGARDKMTPPDAAHALAARLANTKPEIKTIENCGHAIMQQASDALADIATEWLSITASLRLEANTTG